MILQEAFEYTVSKFRCLLIFSRGMAYYMAPYVYEKLGADYFFPSPPGSIMRDYEIENKKFLSLLRNFPTIRYSRTAFCVNDILFDDVINKESLILVITEPLAVIFHGSYKETKIYIFSSEIDFDLTLNSKKIKIFCRWRGDSIASRVIRTPKDISSLSIAAYSKIDFPNLETCYELRLSGRRRRKKFSLDVLSKVYCKLHVYDLELDKEDLERIDKELLKEATLKTEIYRTDMKVIARQLFPKSYVYDLLTWEK